MGDQSKGLLLALAGVIILSPDSLFIRLAEIDDVTLIFYRSLIPAMTIFVILAFHYKYRLLSILTGMGLAGLINGVFYMTTSVTFVLSIQKTSVANTLIILSSAPVFAALLSMIFLSEKQKFTTWVVIGLSIISISIIAFGSIDQASSITGDFFALICAVSTACSAVIVRFYKNRDLVGSIVIGGVLAAVYALITGEIEPLNSSQTVYIAIIGLFVVPVAFILLTIAPRFAQSAEVQLIFLLEAILGPLWVWMVIHETPGMYTMFGGGLLLLSVVWFGYVSAKTNANIT